ncbi:hypothetical protein AVEN_257459-1 [Araneus ventricosus]|uniref:Uncharacterized protein n=1 Tax=Araneus ventricosus TaxID=182803 RepID=A0A4Y2WI60_ARAVE|nr:hypothetical protein AVEN_246531-1 [Araneus ventricosus]GBO36102.1 hypothetical protein AVEN_257459-1 [Araneus ventricosus]
MAGLTPEVGGADFESATRTSSITSYFSITSYSKHYLLLQAFPPTSSISFYFKHYLRLQALPPTPSITSYYRLSHLTSVQNYAVHSKLAHMLL